MMSKGGSVMKKRILAFTVGMILLLSLSGCMRLLDVMTDGALTAEITATPHLGFSNGVILEEEEWILEADALPYETVQFDTYRGTLHYDTLSESEQTVYRALEYAFEKGYTNVLVDQLLIPEAEGMERVLHALALDSPMLEQNLRYEMGTFTTYYPAKILGVLQTDVKFEGTYLKVENFAAEHMPKRLDALEEAKKVVAALKDTLTPEEKAWELYTYLCEHTTYQRYEAEMTQTVYPYLYDGLITGKTQCDGYANSLSLLLNLAVIDCVEKEFKAKEKGEEGHTWNFFQLEGSWYNADATGGHGKDPVIHEYYFAYSDLLQEYTPEHATQYPVSENRLRYPVDDHLQNAKNLNSVLKKAYKRHDNQWALIVMDEVTEKQIKSAGQALADAINGQVHYVHMELAEGRTALWFYNEKYFK